MFRSEPCILTLSLLVASPVLAMPQDESVADVLLTNQPVRVEPIEPTQIHDSEEPVVDGESTSPSAVDPPTAKTDPLTTFGPPSPDSITVSAETNVDSTIATAVDAEQHSALPVEPDHRPLPPRSQSAESSSDAPVGFSVPPGTMRTLGALGLVIGLAILLRFVVGRRFNLLATTRSPSGVMSVAARFPIGKNQSLMILRLPRRLLVVCQTPQGASTLTEITDPQEIAALNCLLNDTDGRSFNAEFDRLINEPETDVVRRSRQSLDWNRTGTGNSDSTQVVDLTRAGIAKVSTPKWLTGMLSKGNLS